MHKKTIVRTRARIPVYIFLYFKLNLVLRDRKAAREQVYFTCNFWRLCCCNSNNAELLFR